MPLSPPGLARGLPVSALVHWPHLGPGSCWDCDVRLICWHCLPNYLQCMHSEVSVPVDYFVVIVEYVM